MSLLPFTANFHKFGDRILSGSDLLGSYKIVGQDIRNGHFLISSPDILRQF